ncbi:MAG: hypothetical protein AVDCRST_MAG64-3361 [uncultured Phycisphaerae bacterium]|uniref:Uncharacterized protein n=1 Tax=uncultured Phycisphaerae bacterium TaxID=904963 RepID=A0A6J4Q3F6_9BACT|nr:MAG: hypothetical protein AVDCRST_MAG64-3361 [uncultured Phycisphaerae bacterium]
MLVPLAGVPPRSLGGRRRVRRHLIATLLPVRLRPPRPS